MGERTHLIGSYEGVDAGGKARRVWVFQRGYRFLIVDWNSARHAVPVSRRDISAVGRDVEQVLGLREPIWRPLF